MMIEKIKKYLLRQPEINFFHKNVSGSEYFKVGESIIRVSNHVAISNNQPDTLNIVVTGENFVVMYGNRLINVNDYTGFKNFLKYHIQMCDCFKDLIHKGLNHTPKGTKPAKKTVVQEEPIQYSDDDIVVTDIMCKVGDLNFDISKLSYKQKKAIVDQRKAGYLKTNSHVITLIQNYKLQKGAK